MTTKEELKKKKKQNYIQVRDHKIPETSSDFNRICCLHLSYRKIIEDFELGTL
jgi:hypothetical protein